MFLETLFCVNWSRNIPCKIQDKYAILNVYEVFVLFLYKQKFKADKKSSFVFFVALFSERKIFFPNDRNTAK